MNALRVLLVVLFASLSVAVSAEERDSQESMVLLEPPIVDGEPMVVEVGVLVMDIDEIDDVNQRFNVDMFLVARWMDHRLALPADERKGKKRFMSLDEVWTPKALFLNDRGLRLHLREGVEVDDRGGVTAMNRLTGELAADLKFEEFPFDVQRLTIDIVSYEYTTDQLRFSPDLNVVSTESRFSIEGWRLGRPVPVVDVFVTPGGNYELPRLTYVIEAKRDSDFYVLTMLLPMSLIIFMAWTVFWLQPDIVAARIAISTAAIFSLIALGVSIRLGLPKISYLTQADVFVISCTLMVYLALGIAVLGSRWANSGRVERALKANAIARWVYIILFVVVAYVTLYR